jgi:DNA (cytosine-5)-methyltransferase 1
MQQQEIQFIIIDLFCGAGGTTTGFEQAMHHNPILKIGKVVACVNHDPVAIQSHWANHPDVEHFEEDITKLYGLIDHGILLRSPNFNRLVRLVNLYRALYPDAKVILWASLECTNFSKAKGGLPRNADSRTLANHLHPYIIAIDPDYIQIENVVEFMAWGPLDENGKPVSKRNGQDWIRWRKSINLLGYYDEWRELNSADFGALTSRNRLFGCFAKPDLPIVWPQPTHTKNPENTSIVKPLKKWEPVKKALDFTDEGNSVFNRKKALSTKTMQRLFMGCVKHIAGGKEHFITKFYFGKPQGKNISIEQPAGTITTSANQGVVKACFIHKYNSNKKVTGGNHGHSVESPAPVIATQARLSLAQAHFIQKYYSNGGQHNSIDEPAATLSTKDRLSKVQADFFIEKQYRGDHNHQSINEPAGSVLTNDKHRLVKAEHYIINPSWGGNSGSINEPCYVVIARQDKAPLYLITCTGGPVSVPVYEDDCQWTIKLKEFMALYGIADIKMRMLKVPELKRIQGFPESYVLLGNQTDQKKFIGNAVHPTVPEHWIKAFSQRLFPDTYQNLKAA